MALVRKLSRGGAEGAIHILAPEKRGWPQRPLWEPPRRRVGGGPAAASPAGWWKSGYPSSSPSPQRRPTATPRIRSTTRNHAPTTTGGPLPDCLWARSMTPWRLWDRFPLGYYGPVSKGPGSGYEMFGSAATRLTRANGSPHRSFAPGMPRVGDPRLSQPVREPPTEFGPVARDPMFPPGHAVDLRYPSRACPDSGTDRGGRGRTDPGPSPTP